MLLLWAILGSTFDINLEKDAFRISLFFEKTSASAATGSYDAFAAYASKIDKIVMSNGTCATALNPDLNTIFVSNLRSSTISVINGVTIAIDVGDGPRGVAVNPATNTLYVTNQRSNTVSVIDGTTNQVVDTINVDQPYEIALNWRTNKVYVTYYGANALPILDGYDRASLLSITGPYFVIGVMAAAASVGGMTVIVVLKRVARKRQAKQG